MPTRPLLALALDVREQAQITETVRAAEARFGSIDVLVNNAGYATGPPWRRAILTTSRACLRPTSSGRSQSSKPSCPVCAPAAGNDRQRLLHRRANLPTGSGYYAASKAALEAMTASLRTELEPLGITAMIVEPGAFRTDFSGRSLTQSDTVIDDYADTAGARPRNATPPTERSRATPQSRRSTDLRSRELATAADARPRPRRA